MPYEIIVLTDGMAVLFAVPEEPQETGPSEVETPQGFIQNTCKNRSRRFYVSGAATKTGEGRNDPMRARQDQ